MRKLMSKLLGITLCLLLIQGCSSTPNYVSSEPNIYKIPKNINSYRIKSVTGDLLQKTDYRGFVSVEQFNELLRHQLEYYLNDNDLLANESGDSNAVDLTIVLDYQRRFMGDETPFPARIIASPKFAFIISMDYQGNTVFYHHSTDYIFQLSNLRGWGSVFSNSTNDKEPMSDIRNINAVIKSIVKDVAEIINHERADEIIPVITHPKALNYLTEYAALNLVPSKQEMTKQYIPEIVATNYIASLSNASDSDERIDIYKEIYKDRLNTPELFKFIEKSIVSQYVQAQERSLIQELRWAMKALASSGNLNYLPLFNTIEKEATNSTIAKYPKTAIKVLYKRFDESKVVHNTQRMNETKDWKTNQLINMLSSQDSNLILEATQNIYRKKQFDLYILNKIEKILSSDTSRNRYRTIKNDDAHAWMVRVLAASGNPKFSSTLVGISKRSVSKKVRAHAAKAAAKLKN